MPIHIVLVEPEIPPNTGNIARSCAATGSVLHLVEPLGFSVDEKSVKRAGLDYWQFVELKTHKSLYHFMEEYKEARMFFATTKGERRYSEVAYKDGDMLVFGKETAGLPKELIEEKRSSTIRIPMSKDTRLRSLNLSNSANIVLFEALRQLDFPNLK